MTKQYAFCHINYYKWYHWKLSGVITFKLIHSIYNTPINQLYRFLFIRALLSDEIRTRNYLILRLRAYQRALSSVSSWRGKNAHIVSSYMQKLFDAWCRFLKSVCRNRIPAGKPHKSALEYTVSRWDGLYYIDILTE